MRWLLIVLLVSLVALLVAAFGLAHQVWIHRAHGRSISPAEAAPRSGGANEIGKKNTF
jgi:protein-S-isoprenylcysteine O-methyltransferase Ste14